MQNNCAASWLFTKIIARCTQLLAYADDVIILGGSVHTVKENAEALVVATKEIGLEGKC